ncbi:hypothetical protein JST97_37460 [bacterium]|nr:hypothetical protein [bacterium]
MKLNSFNPGLAIRGPLLKHRPQTPASQTLQDGFQPTSPPPPLWKKALNGAVGSLAGAGAAATLVTILAAAGQGSAALGAPILGALVGGPIGLVAGAITGWKNCSAEKPSLPRKLVNAASWAVVGAGAGALASVAVAASGMQGPDALASLGLAAPGALLGAGGAAVAGWNLTGGR